MPNSLFLGHALERLWFIFMSKHNRLKNGFLSADVQSLGISGHTRMYEYFLQFQSTVLLNPQILFTFQTQTNTETNKAFKHTEVKLAKTNFATSTCTTTKGKPQVHLNISANLNKAGNTFGQFNVQDKHEYLGRVSIAWILL